MPIPAPIPVNNLYSVSRCLYFEQYQVASYTYRPIVNGVSDAATPIRPAPRAVAAALTRHAPLRPRRSMNTFANKLPMRPPTVYTEVTAENVAFDIGMQVGRLMKVGAIAEGESGEVVV